MGLNLNQNISDQSKANGGKNMLGDPLDYEKILNAGEVQILNFEIGKLSQTAQISDGRFSFDDLYRQNMLLIRIVIAATNANAFITKANTDGNPVEEGYFAVGIHTKEGLFVTHVGMEYWKIFSDLPVSECMPELSGEEVISCRDINRMASLVGGKYDKI